MSSSTDVRPELDTDLLTLPGRLRRQALDRPDATALREKRHGCWRETTWSRYYDNVLRCGKAMLVLGIDDGDHVAILSENRTEWLYADLAAQLIGARSVGIYPTCPAPEVAYQLDHSGSVALIAEDQEQVDKAIACAEDTPSVRHVIVLEPRGTSTYDDPRMLTWQRFVALGDVEPPTVERLERRLGSLDPDEPAMVVYTSGTTGTPKGALVTHRNVTGSADITAAWTRWTHQDSVLSYLPLCHLAEKIFSLYLPLTTGSVVHFGESLATVQRDLVEVGPTAFLGMPRIWEKIHASLDMKLQDTSALKRRIARAFLPRSSHGEGGGGDEPRGGWLADLLVHRPLRERLGLDRCRLPMAGGAPVDAGLLRWFRQIGVPVVEGYGQTECAGITHLNMVDEGVKLGTVGPALDGVECRIADDGEILLRHHAIIFAGYLKDQEATERTIVDGWLHSGDLGSIDEDGYLTITGRKKEIIITAGGKNLSPARIENALKASPYIKEAVSIGDRRRFVSALIQIEYDRVSDWATRERIPHTSFADLVANPQVERLIQAEVDKANEQLARVESVRAFRLLSKELHQDDDELTATQKVRRSVIEDRFADLIEGMYR